MEYVRRVVDDDLDELLPYLPAVDLEGPTDGLRRTNQGYPHALRRRAGGSHGAAPHGPE